MEAPPRVLPLTVVENSDIPPSRLTGFPTLLMIRKLSLPHLSSSEDSYGPLCVVVLVRVLPPLFGTALASWLAPSSPFLLKRKGHPFHRPPSPQAPHPRRLPCLSTRLHSFVGCRASTCTSALLA